MECEQVLGQGTVVSWGKAGEPEQTGWLVSSAPEHPGHTGKLSSSENPQFIHQEHPDLGTGQNIGVAPYLFLPLLPLWSSEAKLQCPRPSSPFPWATSQVRAPKLRPTPQEAEPCTV